MPSTVAKYAKINNGRPAQYFALLGRVFDLIESSDIELNCPPTMIQCEAEWDWKPEPLPDFDLWIVFQGRGILQLEGRSHEIVPGFCAILIPQAEPFGTHDPADPLRVFFCHFDLVGRRAAKRASDQRTQARSDESPLNTVLHDVRDLALVDALSTRAHQESVRGSAKSPLAVSLVRTLLLLIKAEVESPPVGQFNSRLWECIEGFRLRPGHDWDLDDEARRCGLSRSAFNRRFKEVSGQSPNQFLIDCRLARADHLIRESNLTLESIAQGLGYTDVYFFHRQFKKFRGVTPGEVRRRSRLRQG